MIDPTVLVELDRIKTEVNALLPQLGKQKIRELKNVITKHQEDRFNLRHKPPKYGSLNKGFVEQELQGFFAVIDNPKYKLLFSYMAYLGLRIGEVCRLSLENLNLQDRELRLRSEKTNRLDQLRIPPCLFEQTEAFITAHKQEIEQANGYLFFKELNVFARQELYVEKNYVRKLFRSYIIASGLDETYDVSEEVTGRKQRKLHRLTTHSLRHYAISHFARETNGNIVLTSKFARHLKPETTTTYIHTEKEELYREIDKAFANQAKI